MTLGILILFEILLSFILLGYLFITNFGSVFILVSISLAITNFGLAFILDMLKIENERREKIK